MDLRIFDLQKKEVINEKDCKRLGYVADVEFDIHTCCIEALIIPGEGKICGLFGREEEFVIPCKCVKKIGEDIIIVCVDEDEIRKKC